LLGNSLYQDGPKSGTGKQGTERGPGSRKRPNRSLNDRKASRKNCEEGSYWVKIVKGAQKDDHYTIQPRVNRKEREG